MFRVPYFSLIFLSCFGGCSVFESVETKEYAMTWEVERDQNSKGHNLVEFEFVDFPGHVIGHFSNDLIKHLEEKGELEVVVKIEITRDVFGEVIGHSESDIAASMEMLPPFAYFGVSGDPPGFSF
jgi:3-deoxy-D-arabino-heptulosonate 7-phosphate (DAHP) synthase